MTSSTADWVAGTSESAGFARAGALHGSCLAPSRGARVRRLASLTGPAVVVSVAYLDPGNIAVNFEAGAHYGYSLLWVVLLANAMAILFQGLSAKLGIVTGQNLAEQCRRCFPAPVVWCMWGVSELAAMATDLAEFIGAALGFSLLLGVPIIAGMALAALITCGLLLLQNYGFRPLELTIAGFVAIVSVAFVLQAFILDPDWHAMALHTVTPVLKDGGATALAAGIVGATVMPHALFLHSSLTQDRIVATNDLQKRSLLRFSRYEVLVALGLSGLVNMALLVAAAALYSRGAPAPASVEIADVFWRLLHTSGVLAAGVFLAGLLASGVSSSVVGTLAGQVVMQGFLEFRTPMWVRRAVTMVPGFLIVAFYTDATHALVLSQVVLSLTLPAPLIALVVITGRREIMGPFATGKVMRAAAIFAAAIIVALNAALVLQASGLLS